jgi:hypothetical protein
LEIAAAFGLRALQRRFSGGINVLRSLRLKRFIFGFRGLPPKISEKTYCAVTCHCYISRPLSNRKADVYRNH